MSEFGTEVPANMRHYIDALMAAGLLVDEHGNKITDTEAVIRSAAVPDSDNVAMINEIDAVRNVAR